MMYVCICVSEHDSFQNILSNEFPFGKYVIDHSYKNYIAFCVNRLKDYVFKLFSSHFATDRENHQGNVT